MATYGEKVRKYEAIVRKALDLGQEPEERALKKLYYYVGRTEKKGADHETKLKDKTHWMTVSVAKNAKALLKEAANILGAG